MTREERNLLSTIAKAQLAQLEMLTILLTKNYFGIDHPIVVELMKKIGGSIGGLEYDLRQFDK